VAVWVALDGAIGEASAIDYAGVVELVEVRDVAAPDEGGDDAEVGLVPSTEDQCRLFVEEPGESFLELLVQIEGAVEETAPGTAATVAAQCGLCRLEDPWVMGESEVVVGSHHHLALASYHDLGVVGRLDRHEIRVE